MSPPAPAQQLDHLVVVAASLAEGVAWCEATLGITPGPGGRHALMGTHNRLFKIASPGHPRAYFEIIAIDPDASPTRPPPARRWFDMDDAALATRVAHHGPQLVHWVASVPDLDTAVAALAAQALDPGRPLEASRPLPDGALLQWRITVRDDGQRLLGGALPALISWGAVHPTDAMPASGVRLQDIALTHPQPATLAAACRAIGLALPVQAGPAGLQATLDCPKGLVRLTSFGA